jgi:transglutaminase-like putative cysteine protease
MRPSIVESNPTSKFAERGSQNQDYQPAYRSPFHPPIAVSVYPTAKPAIQRTKRPLVLAPAEGWFALVLVAIAVYAVVFTIISARWVNHTSILYWSAAPGLLVGLLVAKVERVPQAILHLGAFLVGHWFSVWLTSAIAFHISWMLVLATLRAAITARLSPATLPGGDIVFLFYLSFLCYYLGYFGSWLTYRAHLPWLVALVYCSVLLINLNYVREDLSLVIFILLAALLLLIARIQLVTQLTSWTSEGLVADRSWLRKTTWHFMQWASILTLLMLCISSLLPIQDQPAAGVVFWNSLDNAWANISHGHISLQDPILIIQPSYSTANFFGDRLSLSNDVSLPSGEVLYYSSSAAPQYLEGFTFDHFDGHTWVSSPTFAQQDFPAGSPLPGAQGLENSGTNYMLATTDVTMVHPPVDADQYIFAPAQPATFTVATSVYLDGMVSDWRQQRPLTAGEHYRATSHIPTATAQNLSVIPLPTAGQGQAQWSSDRNYNTLVTYYLQTPDDLSSQVAVTARQWTRGATNTYTAVKMLESHLNDAKQFTYSLDNPPVPENIDAVTWLLQTHSGYCTYYATAMTMMARLLGIPARIANGFSYGQFDPHRKVWIVDGTDAHSWVQIYFPGYGWINFDPTPGFSLQTASHLTHPGPTASPVPTGHPAQPTPENRPRSASRATGRVPIYRARGRPYPTTASWASPYRIGVGLAPALGAALAVLFILLFAFCSYWWRMLYTKTNFVSGMFWRACQVASWAGMPPRGWQTPYEYSSMLIRHVPYEAAPLRRLTDLFVRDRWAAPHEVPYVPEEDDLERLWPHLRRVFLRLIVLRVSKGLVPARGTTTFGSVLVPLAGTREGGTRDEKR